MDTLTNKAYPLGDEYGFIELVDTGGTDLSTVNAARVSFGVEKQVFDEKDEKLLRYLLTHEHESPLEHTMLTFRVRIPLALRAQWVRHRVGVSYNELSRRYTSDNIDFYLPKQFRQQASSNRQCSDGNVDDNLLAAEILLHAYKNALTSYHQLLEAGVCREQARFALPEGMYTTFIWTCNLRSMFHFIELRDSEHAQWEIRQYAKEVARLAEGAFPNVMRIWKELKQQ